MKQLLGPLGSRVIDKTPVLTGPKVQDADIQRWLSLSPHHHYLVLDDDPSLFLEKLAAADPMHSTHCARQSLLAGHVRTASMTLIH